MNITPDSIIYFRIGSFALSATIVNTWIIMVLLSVVSWYSTRKFSIEAPLSKWQNFMESLVGLIRSTIRDVTMSDSDVLLPFIGTLFLFISISNLSGIIPFFASPTGSLYTTSALALSVFFAVPVFGIGSQGVKQYLKHFFEPTWIVMPFNVIGELSRTLALSVRLFGNILSGALIGGILLSFVPLLFPVVMNLFSLLIGQIQAYIFAVLSTVYIGSGLRVSQKKQ
jgi:F-type H+-transporting ATPase subunit a